MSQSLSAPMPSQSNTVASNLTRWERAYQAFETPEEELAKFLRRLRSIGADRWHRQSRILEVCSGRGSGLRAWHHLGFRRIYGVDFSPALVSTFTGPGQCVIGDIRSLPLESASVDVVVVQGGLHHLFATADVELALAEMTRVTTTGGRVVIVEPWLTPFLRLVHGISSRTLARRLSSKIDAFATMVDEERPTYERWLNAPDEHLRLFQRFFVAQLVRREWGKITVVGSPRR